jgi:hypothetical protein
LSSDCGRAARFENESREGMFSSRAKVPSRVVLESVFQFECALETRSGEPLATGILTQNEENVLARIF